jgi:hypothetical protein
LRDGSELKESRVGVEALLEAIGMGEVVKEEDDEEVEAEMV